MGEGRGGGEPTVHVYVFGNRAVNLNRCCARSFCREGGGCGGGGVPKTHTRCLGNLDRGYPGGQREGHLVLVSGGAVPIVCHGPSVHVW
jgi:hypothetical protein